MKNRLLFYDVNGRGLALPASWQISEAGDRHWLARDGLLIPLPDSLRARPSRLSAAELDAIKEAIPGSRWCTAADANGTGGPVIADADDPELSDQGATP